MQTKRRIIAAKVEGAEGTPEDLTAAETGILASNPSYTPDFKMLPREVVMATFSKLPDLVGARMAQITFRAEVIGRGVAYAAAVLPRLDPYFRACGLVPEIDVTPGAEKVTYKRASANIPSLTCGFLDDDDAGGAVIKKIAGARGNVDFVGDTGGSLFAEISLMGIYLDVADGAQLVASYDDVMPPQLLGVNFDMGGFTPSINTIRIGLGNKVAGVPDMSKESGYKAFRITDGDTRGNFDPEMVKVATKDYYGGWKAGLAGALSIGAFGPAQYNQVKITAPKQVTTKVAEGEREGQQIVNVDYQLAMNAGDDEFVLEFS